MRLSLRFQLDPGELILPLSYNHLVQAMIYSNIDNSIAHWLHDRGFAFGKRRYKLFTFSRLLSKKRRLNRDIREDKRRHVVVPHKRDDYFSRFTLSCHSTFSLSAKEGIKALEKAYEKAKSLHSSSFEGLATLLTDNGSTFIAKQFRDFLKKHFENFFRHIKVKYRSPEQIGVIERFHQNLKQEAFYPAEVQNVLHLINTVEHYTWYPGSRRPPWASGLRTPAEVHLNKSFHEIRKLGFDSNVTGYKTSIQEMHA